MVAKVKQAKKMTRNEIEHRLHSAVVFIPKDKETKSIYFDDKGLRVTVTDDYAIIATTAHSHVFSKLTPSGISRPYLYAQRFLEIALSNECEVKDERGNVRRSYAKLFANLKAKDDKTQYNIAWYVDLWLMNIFAPLYSIDESEAGSFIVYEEYLHNIAKQQVILSEKTEDMTNRQYVDKVIENEQSYIDGLEEHVIFNKKTDDEKAQEEVQAMQEAMIQEETRKEGEDGKQPTE